MLRFPVNQLEQADKDHVQNRIGCHSHQTDTHRGSGILLCIKTGCKDFNQHKGNHTTAHTLQCQSRHLGIFKGELATFKQSLNNRSRQHKQRNTGG